ncbi:hypothetical protein C8J57DRAFT_1165245 [Mycena rebaudengoi]|nr:hypothetical protein C8J57DRAFT_1165245 [Mycena rebaudengoi]
MLARRLSRQVLLLNRPRINCIATRSRWSHLPSVSSALPRLSNFYRQPIRAYSDVSKAQLEANGLLMTHAEQSKRALVLYGENYWSILEAAPEGWSTDWAKWDYLLTLYALSPYFLRIPQIEMLVNIKYGIPGETRPIMYSDEAESLVFAIYPQQPPKDVEQNTEDGEQDIVEESDDEDPFPPQFFLLQCRTSELYAFYADEDSAQTVPDTEAELIQLIAEDPESLPVAEVEVDPEGEAALQRILDRDETVIPLLESQFLGYAPRPTKLSQELPSHWDHRASLENAMNEARTFIDETEELVRLNKEDLDEFGEKLPNPELEMKSHQHMQQAVDEAKAKLGEWEVLYQKHYGNITS